MPSPFENYDLQKASSALMARKDNEVMVAARAFVMGDHWQDGKGYTGPRFPENTPLYSVTMTEIQKMFAVENIIGEGVYRHADGTVGVEPSAVVVPNRVIDEENPATDEETGLVTEATSLLRAWGNDRNLHEDWQHAVETLLWGASSYMRLFIPRGELRVRKAQGEDGQDQVIYEIPNLSPEKSLKPVYINTPQPFDAITVKDRDTQQEAGVYLSKMDDKTVAEITFLADEDAQGNRATVVRVIGEETKYEGRFPLGGRLLHYEMRRRALVTEPICSLQRTLNKDLTMMSNHLTMAGFLERVLLNVEMPFHYETDPETGLQVKVYDEMQVGGGTVNVLQGVRYKDKDRNEHIAPASIQYHEPSSSDIFLEPADSLRTGILRQMSQLHVAMTGDGSASAVSRIQARADYLVSLMRTASQVEAAGRWLFETLLALSGLLQGEPGKYAGLRVDMKVRLDPGPIPAEEIDAVLAQVEKKLMSRRTAMERLGMEPDTEEAQIERENQPAQEAAEPPKPDAEGGDADESGEGDEEGLAEAA